MCLWFWFPVGFIFFVFKAGLAAGVGAHLAEEAIFAVVFSFGLFVGDVDFSKSVGEVNVSHLLLRAIIGFLISFVYFSIFFAQKQSKPMIWHRFALVLIFYSIFLI